MNNSFDILKVAESIEIFMKGTVEEFNAPDLDRLRSIGNSGDIVIISSVIGKKVNIIIAILHEKVSEGTVKIRSSVMSKEVKEVKLLKTSVVYFIEKKKVYPGNFIGDNKKEFLSYLKSLTETVDKSVRIGGLYMTEDLKDSEEAKGRIKEVEEFFAKHYPGLDVSFRWSHNSGKPVKIDSAGFNILAKNKRVEEFNSLFKSGTHYYSKHKLFVFTRESEKKKLKIEPADQVMIDMIKEYIPEIIDVKVDKTNGKVVKEKETPNVIKTDTKKEAIVSS